MSLFNPRKRGQELGRKFVSLGDLRGKTRAEIVAVAGQPNGATKTDTGWLVQWIAPGYHIALEFDAQNRVVSIRHEGRF